VQQQPPNDSGDGSGAASGDNGSGAASGDNGSGDDYEVEALVKSRKRKGVAEFLVKWAGFGDKDNSWEPGAGLPQGLVAGFHEAGPRPPKRGRSWCKPGGAVNIQAKDIDSKKLVFLLARESPLRRKLLTEADAQKIPLGLASGSDTARARKEFRAGATGTGAGSTYVQVKTTKFLFARASETGKCFAPATAFACGTVKCTSPQFRGLDRGVAGASPAELLVEMESKGYYLERVHYLDEHAFFSTCGSGAWIIHCAIGPELAAHYIAYDAWRGVLYEPYNNEVEVIKLEDLEGRGAFKARRTAGGVPAGAHHPFDELLSRLEVGKMTGFYQVWQKATAPAEPMSKNAKARARKRAIKNKN